MSGDSVVELAWMARGWARIARVAVSVGIAWLVAGPMACGGSDGEDDDGSGGGNRACPALCSEAQAGDCTTVTGDCDAFCTAIERAAPKAGCDDERVAYKACLNSEELVCNAGCSSSEDALTDCMTPYCLQNSSDPDCVTLLASF
jgi:hypothetical protein